MDHEEPLPGVTERRRRHSPAFKTQVLAECQLRPRDKRPARSGSWENRSPHTGFGGAYNDLFRNVSVHSQAISRTRINLVHIAATAAGIAKYRTICDIETSHAMRTPATAGLITAPTLPIPIHQPNPVLLTWAG